MSTPPSMALAVPFTWTQGGAYDLRLEFASGTSPVDTLVDNGTYSVNLAPALSDFLRKVATEVTVALAGAGRAETCTASIGATGLVTLTLSAAATWTLTSDLRDALGMGASSYSSTTSITGAYPPAHLYLFLGGDSKGWQRKEPFAAARNQAGSVFGVRSGIVSDADTFALELIPSDPAAGAAADETATPWRPGTATLPWSCQRLITTGFAVTCAWTKHWQAVRASTSESYDLVTIDPEALSAPDARQQFPGLTSWLTWSLPLVRLSTSTRA
jgi:hypothetical protein